MASVAQSSGGIVNGTSSSGIISMLLGNPSLASGRYVAVAAVLASLLLLFAFSSPRVGPGEPPVVKPLIPLVGHIIGIMRHQARYHVMLYRKTNRPIATLPMLNGKIYAVWDPALVAAGLRNKDLSSNPAMTEMSRAIFDTNADTQVLINDPDERLMKSFMSTLAPALAGENVRPLNAKALQLLGDHFAGMDRVTTQQNMWAWIRDLTLGVTAKALYGEADPFSKDETLSGSLWDFQAHLPLLFLNFFPRLTTPTGFRARAHLQAAFRPYYASSHDADAAAAEIVRARGRVLRHFGLPAKEVAKIEMMLPFAATTNTLPSLYWLLVHILAAPGLADRISQEVAQGLVVAPPHLVEKDGPSPTAAAGEREVWIDLSDVEARAPRLVAAYRETLRVVNHQVSIRRCVRDTTLADGGRSYTLRKGVDVHLAVVASLLDRDVWGDAADEFDPDRFLDGGGGGEGDAKGGSKGSGAAAAAARARRNAYQPFGGGAHLCPGRHFAFVEIVGVVVVLLLGYDLSPVSEEGGWKVPRQAPWSMVDSITKPENHGEGLGVRLAKKEGWENVRWRFKL